MRFTLEIELGNDAMQTGYNVARAMREASNHVAELVKKDLPGAEGRIRDVNGNTVGKWQVLP
jgi:hypothetical protein